MLFDELRSNSLLNYSGISTDTMLAIMLVSRLLASISLASSLFR